MWSPIVSKNHSPFLAHPLFIFRQNKFRQFLTIPDNSENSRKFQTILYNFRKTKFEQKILNL